MSLLLRFVTPPAAEIPAPLAFFTDPPRRRSLAALGGAAALLLAPILAPPPPVSIAAGPARRSAPSSVAFPLDPIAAEAPLDFFSPVYVTAPRRAPRGGSWPEARAPDAIRSAPPSVFSAERARSRAESRSAPLLPEAVRAPPPSVQDDRALARRAESRSAPLLPDAVRLPPPPIQLDHAHKSRVESRSQPLLPDAMVEAPLPVLVDTAGENEHHRQRRKEQDGATGLLPDTLRDLYRAETSDPGRKHHHDDSDPIANAPVQAPETSPIFRGSSPHKKKRQWLDLQATAQQGRVVLTIEELLEPEPLPPVKQVELDPLIVEILAETPGLEIHDTPELRALRAEVAALRAQKAESAGKLVGAERSARRWRFGAVGLAVVLALVGIRRR